MQIFISADATSDCYHEKDTNLSTIHSIPISSNIIIILNVQYYPKTSLKLFVHLSLAFNLFPVSRFSGHGSPILVFKFSTLEIGKRKNFDENIPSNPAFCLSTVTRFQRNRRRQIFISNTRRWKNATAKISSIPVDSCL